MGFKKNNQNNTANSNNRISKNRNNINALLGNMIDVLNKTIKDTYVTLLQNGQLVDKNCPTSRPIPFYQVSKHCVPNTQPIHCCIGLLLIGLLPSVCVGRRNWVLSDKKYPKHTFTTLTDRSTSKL